MELTEVMQDIKIVVDAELRQFFASKRKEAARIHPSAVELVDQIADVTLRGGKRIRPFLAWVGYHAIKFKNQNSKFKRTSQKVKITIPKPLMQVMVGLELFQTFALIHDDIMDQDKERRGGPTIHERSGVNMAILAGDLALAWADEEMDAHDDIRSLYQKMKEEVIYGQTLDIVGGSKEKADELKTAWYSIVRPLQIGSSLAFKDSLSGRLSLLKMWEQYGVPVGKLFQLRDDVLDGELTKQEFEKAAGSLRERALAALGQLKASSEIKQLLIDFTQFVQNRQS